MKISENTPIAGISAPVGAVSGLFMTQYTMPCSLDYHYAIGNDIFTDKVIAKDQSTGRLKLKDSKEEFKNAKCRVFKYIGENDQSVIFDTLFNTIKRQEPVADGHIYEVITNKKLLDDEQIRFDNLFEEVDYDKIEGTTKTKIFSLFNQYRTIAGESENRIPLMNQRDISIAEEKRKDTNNINIYESFKGYYAVNEATGSRTGYYESIEDILIESL